MQEDVDARERFMNTLDWLLALKDRHDAGMEFGLVCVEFSDPIQLGVTYGAPRAARMLADVSERLRSVFRRTDLIARDGANFWILVPLTEANAVVDKVRETVQAAAENGLDIVPHQVAVFNFDRSAGDLRSAGSSSAEFLSRVRRTLATRPKPGA